MLLKHDKITKIISLTSQYSPVVIGIFGSYARNESMPDSDLDILIDFHDKVNLLDIIGMEQAISDALDIKVDLVTKQSLDTLIEASVYNDLKIIYEG